MADETVDSLSPALAEIGESVIKADGDESGKADDVIRGLNDAGCNQGSQESLELD